MSKRSTCAFQLAFPHIDTELEDLRGAGNSKSGSLSLGPLVWNSCCVLMSSDGNFCNMTDWPSSSVSKTFNFPIIKAINSYYLHISLGCTIFILEYNLIINATGINKIGKTNRKIHRPSGMAHLERMADSGS